MFEDTITLYNKISDEAWERTVIHGVQWADKFERQNNDGKISIARYASITFPEGTYEGLTLDPKNEEDAIVYGETLFEVDGTKGHRISDLLKKYSRAGIIKSVNDNSNRAMLKNKKVVIG